MKNPSSLAGGPLLTALAAAALLACHLDAQAFSLGRMTVQSSLGEPLRAEIEVNNLSADEAGSLEASLASAESFRAAGVDFNATLAGLQAKVQRSPDGRAVIRLTGERSVTEPFVDVILDFNWSSGRLQRAYTLLVDPPLRTTSASTGAVTSPVLSAAPVAAPALPAPVVVSPPAPVEKTLPAAEPAAVPAAQPQPVPQRPATRERTTAATPPPAPVRPAKPMPQRSAPVEASAAKLGDASGYRVRSGDTLTTIAAAKAPAVGVSLDQMLVGLYRANPQAFVSENMNRLKAGVVLAVPDADKAREVSSDEAKRVIQAQSADFGAYRHRLAGSAPTVKAQEPERQTQGKLEAKVQDRKAASAAQPDKLTLSRSGGKPGSVEAKISKETERKAADARVGELSRNLEELKRLSGAVPAGTATNTASAAKTPDKNSADKGNVRPAVPVAAVAPPAPPPAPAAKPAPAPVPPAPAPTVKPPAPVVVPPVVASVPPVAAASKPVVVPPPPPVASAPVVPPVVPPVASAVQQAPVPVAVAPVASAPARPASQAPVKRPPAAPVVPVAEPEEEGLFDSLTSNPFVLPGAVGLVALLAGLGAMRLRRKPVEQPTETSFMESKLQADSFFGVSGGQRVDTRDGSSTSSSSLSYSLSQLDAIGDVDPVAEADVYLAYGRDLQAEEILKEALRTDQHRLAIRTKLLEVYAKRTDITSFGSQAQQLLEMTGGVGEDWLKAQDLGRQIDPTNPLYEPLPVSEVDIDTSMDAAGDMGDDPVHGRSADPRDTTPSSFDANWEIPLSPAPAPSAKTKFAARSASAGAFDLDIDLNAPSKLTGLESTRPATVMPSLSGMSELATDHGNSVFPDIGHTSMDPLPDLSDLEGMPPPKDPPDSGPVDFDFGDLSLELDEPGAAPASGSAKSASALAGVRDLPMMSLDMGDMGDMGLGGGTSSGEDDAESLQGKVELADEFRRIGDIEGARELLEEVVSRAGSALRMRAQAMLDELD